MSDQPEKVGRTRISVTLTKPYLDALSRWSRGVSTWAEARRPMWDALRRLFRHYGM